MCHLNWKLSQIYQLGNFSGPTWTYFKSWSRDAYQWLKTSELGKLPPPPDLTFNFIFGAFFSVLAAFWDVFWAPAPWKIPLEAID